MSTKSYWCEKVCGIKPGKIVPWKLPRNKHAIISVMTHTTYSQEYILQEINKMNYEL